jgi:hypothetical protein
VPRERDCRECGALALTRHSSHGSAISNAALHREISLEQAKLRADFFDFFMAETESDKVALLPQLSHKFCELLHATEPALIPRQVGRDALKAFVQQLCKTFVHEMRDRASNTSTEMASDALATYLSQPDAAGFCDLRALLILAKCENEIVQTMIKASVPSTLVKALYLFYDLPDVSVDAVKTSQRTQMQETFIQLLCSICQHPASAREITEMQDLGRLFDLLTTPCPAYNSRWHKGTAEVLRLMLRRSTDEIIKYIHENGCISCTIEMLQQDSSSFIPSDVVDIFETLCVCLKESGLRSTALLDDFTSCQGYSFAQDLALSVEQDWAETAPAELSGLVTAIAKLSFYGTAVIPPVVNRKNVFLDPSFQVPTPQGPDTCVRDLHAISVLYSLFLKA